MGNIYVLGFDATYTSGFTVTPLAVIADTMGPFQYKDVVFPEEE